VRARVQIVVGLVESMEKLRPGLERTTAIQLAESIEDAIFSKITEKDCDEDSQEYKSKCREIRQNLTNRQVRCFAMQPWWKGARGATCDSPLFADAPGVVPMHRALHAHVRACVRACTSRPPVCVCVCVRARAGAWLHIIGRWVRA